MESDTQYTFAYLNIPKETSKSSTVLIASRCVGRIVSRVGPAYSRSGMRPSSRCAPALTPVTIPCCRVPCMARWAGQVCGVPGGCPANLLPVHGLPELLHVDASARGQGPRFAAHAPGGHHRHCAGDHDCVGGCARRLHAGVCDPSPVCCWLSLFKVLAWSLLGVLPASGPVHWQAAVLFRSSTVLDVVKDSVALCFTVEIDNCELRRKGAASPGVRQPEGGRPLLPQPQTSS
jgi:hypothetical protein